MSRNRKGWINCKKSETFIKKDKGRKGICKSVKKKGYIVCKKGDYLNKNKKMCSRIIKRGFVNCKKGEYLNKKKKRCMRVPSHSNRTSVRNRKKKICHLNNDCRKGEICNKKINRCQPKKSSYMRVPSPSPSIVFSSTLSSSSNHTSVRNSKKCDLNNQCRKGEICNKKINRCQPNTISNYLIKNSWESSVSPVHKVKKPPFLNKYGSKKKKKKHLDKPGKHCENGKWDIIKSRCVCNDGYEWNNGKKKCVAQKSAKSSKSDSDNGTGLSNNSSETIFYTPPSSQKSSDTSSGKKSTENSQTNNSWQMVNYPIINNK